MKRLMIAVMSVATACACVLPGFGAPIKERDWQEGKLTDIISEPYTVGYMANGVGGVAQLERISYVIDTGKYIYTLRHIHHRKDTAMSVTVNTTVKFAVTKDKAYLVDEEGEEHELKFVKKTLKDATKER